MTMPRNLAVMQAVMFWPNDLVNVSNFLCECLDVTNSDDQVQVPDQRQVTGEGVVD